MTQMRKQVTQLTKKKERRQAQRQYQSQSRRKYDEVPRRAKVERRNRHRGCQKAHCHPDGWHLEEKHTVVPGPRSDQKDCYHAEPLRSPCIVPVSDGASDASSTEERLRREPARKQTWQTLSGILSVEYYRGRVPDTCLSAVHVALARERTCTLHSKS